MTHISRATSLAPGPAAAAQGGHGGQGAGTCPALQARAAPPLARLPPGTAARAAPGQLCWGAGTWVVRVWRGALSWGQPAARQKIPRGAWADGMRWTNDAACVGRGGRRTRGGSASPVAPRHRLTHRSPFFTLRGGCHTRPSANPACPAGPSHRPLGRPPARTWTPCGRGRVAAPLRRVRQAIVPSCWGMAMRVCELMQWWQHAVSCGGGADARA